MASLVSPENFALANYDCKKGVFMISRNISSLTLDVIVGAGTAGLTLANRLTENPKINVGVLEAVSIPNSFVVGINQLMTIVN